MVTEKKYIIISILGLTAAFAVQMLWLINSLLITSNKIETAISEKLEMALFEEAEERACTYGQSIPVSPQNSNQPDITYFETMLYQKTKSSVSLQTLEKILSKNIPADYSIILIRNGRNIYYKQNGSYKLTVKSKIIYTKTDKSEAFQIELLNPYSVFFEELGFLMFSSFLMLLVTIFCISQQVNIIRAQQKQARIKKDFTYSMIHDIKTPLSTIRLGLTALDNDKIVNNEEKRTKYLQIISTETQHAYNLINRILTISKSESKKLELHKEELELATILSSIENNFMANQNKTIVFKNQLNYQYIYADFEYLKEIFYNLIDNSIKYSNENVTICISSEKVDKGVVVRIWDNGIGITKTDQNVIFEKYERASASKHNFKKGGASGFGLGLTYVFQVVDAHRGMVSVDGELGKYTEFTIFLPDQSENCGGARKT